MTFTHHVIGDGYVRIAKMDINDALAFFVVQCRGVKFYDMVSECRMRQSEVTFRRFPSNPYDSFCVEALIPRESAHGYEKLGHVARDPVRLLSPLLLAPFKITG